MKLNRLESENSRQNVINRLTKDKRPVKIYGSGRFATFAASIILENSIHLLGFIDDEKYYFPGKKIKWGGVEYPCECISFLNNKDNYYNVVMGIEDYRKIKHIKALLNENVLVEWLDNVDFHYMEDGFLDMHKREIEIIRDKLCDDESKEVLDAFLFARYTGDSGELVKLVHDDRYTYAWELIGITEKDVIVDGGAYVGDTIDEMMVISGRKVGMIYGFEPDKKNYEKLKSNILKNRYKNVVAVNAALYSNDGTLKFSSSGTMGARIKDKG